MNIDEKNSKQNFRKLKPKIHKTILYHDQVYFTQCKFGLTLKIIQYNSCVDKLKQINHEIISIDT